MSYIGEDFMRVKVGIGRDQSKDLADFVLSKIKDTKLFDEATEKACQKTIEVIKEIKQ